jgi:hypothetical protein
MKRTLILFTFLIALPLIAHTQGQYKDSLNWKELDSLSIERRLVVLGVRSLDYYIELDKNNRSIIHTYAQLNEHNVRYIAQLEGLNKGLSEELNEELTAKKKWRNATLLISGANVIFLTSFFLDR